MMKLIRFVTTGQAQRARGIPLTIRSLFGPRSIPIGIDLPAMNRLKDSFA